MRRVARRLFTLCSVISLLLCVAMCVLWVRSYYVSDLRVIAQQGEGVERVWASEDGRFGVGLSSVDSTTGKRFFMYLSPHYYVRWVVRLGTLPFLWLLAWAVRRHIRLHNPHACPKCGYDLRASPERCPECGASNPSAA